MLLHRDEIFRNFTIISAMGTINIAIMMRKTVRVVVVVLAVLLLLLILLPYAFRAKIVERVKHEVNEQVEARVDFGRFGLSVLRSFPDVSLRISDIVVINEAPFEGDTLASIGRMVLTIDLRSVIGADGYEIKRIRLQSPDLRLRFLEDRSANWDIFPAAVHPKDRPEPDEDPGFSLALRSVEIRNGRFFYYDDVYLTYIDAAGIHGRFRGDLTMDVTNISTRDTRIETFSLRYDRFPVLSNVQARLVAEMEMNVRDWVFDFRDNELLINALPVQFDGLISLPPGGGTMMDFSFAASRSDFGAFLSLVPAIYTDDFASLKTSGNLMLHGNVNGLLKGERIPAFDMRLKIDDGMFQYPGLPSSVSDVQVDARMFNEGNRTDQVVIQVPELRMMLAGNPVSTRFGLRTPVSDPHVNMGLDGTLNLADIGTFFPLEEGMILEGLLESRLEAAGYLSALETGAYRNFHAEGWIRAGDIVAEAGFLPARLELPRAEATFSPQHLRVRSLQAKLGDSDVQASGRIDNIIQYLLDGQVLKGHFDVRSSYLDINQLMPGAQEPEKPVARRPATPEEKRPLAPGESPEEDPVALSVINVPENIDFILDARVGQLVFGKMQMQNLGGRLRVANRQANMERLAMDMLGGRLTLNGSYHTRDALPDVSFALDFSSFDLTEAFQTLNTVRVLAPIGKYARGRISGGLTLNTQLDEGMMPVLASLSGRGNVRSENLTVDNHPAMLNLAERIHVDLFKQMDVRNVSLRFSFADGKVETTPFDIRFGRSQAQISGTTWFDQRIDYAMRVDIPREQFGREANQVLDNLVSQAAARGIRVDPGDSVRLDVHLGGTVTGPEVSVSMPGVMDAVRDQLRDEVDRVVREAEDRIREEVDRARTRAEDAARERIDDTREQVQEDLEARAKALIEEAEARAASIRREAARAADRIREEARKQADRMVEEASGAVAKAAARRAGDIVVAEADRRANQLEEEADRRAGEIVDEARKKKEEVLRGN